MWLRLVMVLVAVSVVSGLLVWSWGWHPREARRVVVGESGVEVERPSADRPRVEVTRKIDDPPPPPEVEVEGAMCSESVDVDVGVEFLGPYEELSPEVRAHVPSGGVYARLFDNRIAYVELLSGGRPTRDRSWAAGVARDLLVAGNTRYRLQKTFLEQAIATRSCLLFDRGRLWPEIEPYVNSRIPLGNAYQLNTSRGKIVVDMTPLYRRDEDYEAAVQEAVRLYELLKEHHYTPSLVLPPIDLSPELLDSPW